jgi:8-amino-3,8-dideoxy-alpha-D-manno-octulosonate transaminase
VKTITTGEGGMIITDDESLWRAMSEYQDHGHDHKVNPGGRGGEGRSFVGFNYRMMELQGAIGIAQLAKLDSMIEAQKENKDRLKATVARISGVEFREQIDPAGDSATFLAFFLPDGGRRREVGKVLQEHGAGAICWAENNWHFYPRWEHLLGASTQARNGWPFMEPGGRRRVIYDKDALPNSAALLDRSLCYPISINMSEERLQEMEQAIKKAARI